MKYILVFLLTVSVFAYDLPDPPVFEGDHYDNFVEEEDGITYGMLENGLWYKELSIQQADVIEQYEDTLERHIFISKVLAGTTALLALVIVFRKD